jgi:hypothetical protein
MADPTREELQEWADACAQAALLALAGVPVYSKHSPTQQSFSWVAYVNAIKPGGWPVIQKRAPHSTLRQMGFTMQHNLPYDDPYSTAQYLYYLRDQLLKEIANDA